MRGSKTILFILAIMLSLAWFSSTGDRKNARTTWTGNNPKEYTAGVLREEKVRSKAAEARTFVQQNNFNESVCFLSDMSLPSGQNRFFIYDLGKDSLQSAGLVTHGNCNEDWLEGRRYDNVVGCGCTSLGKYRVGYPYHGRFGLAFKLYGLDKTNDKAFARFVVLHAHDCVPESEVQDDICQSNGCPTVSPGFLQQLKDIINASKKPVLLWIYE